MHYDEWRTLKFVHDNQTKMAKQTKTCLHCVQSLKVKIKTFLDNTSIIYVDWQTAKRNLWAQDLGENVLCLKSGQNKNVYTCIPIYTYIDHKNFFKKLYFIPVPLIKISYKRWKSYLNFTKLIILFS